MLARRPTPMHQGPIHIPPGLPPGTEYDSIDGPPDSVWYMRIFAIVVGLLSIGLFASGIILPMIAASGTGTTSTLPWGVGLFYAVIGLAMVAACAIILFGGRTSWVHTTGIVLLALGTMTICCLPLCLPLMISWVKPETARWYGSR